MHSNVGVGSGVGGVSAAVGVPFPSASADQLQSRLVQLAAASTPMTGSHEAAGVLRVGRPVALGSPHDWREAPLVSAGDGGLPLHPFSHHHDPGLAMSSPLAPYGSPASMLHSLNLASGLSPGGAFSTGGHVPPAALSCPTTPILRHSHLAPPPPQQFAYGAPLPSPPMLPGMPLVGGPLQMPFGMGLTPGTTIHTPTWSYSIPIHKKSRGLGVSCHHCKVSKEKDALYFCTNTSKAGAHRKLCHKKFCRSCIRRMYPQLEPTDETKSTWLCPSCLDLCPCASCVSVRAMNKEEAATLKMKLEKAAYAMADMKATAAAVAASSAAVSAKLKEKEDQRAVRQQREQEATRDREEDDDGEEEEEDDAEEESPSKQLSSETPTLTDAAAIAIALLPKDTLLVGESSTAPSRADGASPTPTAASASASETPAPVIDTPKSAPATLASRGGGGSSAASSVSSTPAVSPAIGAFNAKKRARANPSSSTTQSSPAPTPPPQATPTSSPQQQRQKSSSPVVQLHSVPAASSTGAGVVSIAINSPSLEDSSSPMVHPLHLPSSQRQRSGPAVFATESHAPVMQAQPLSAPIVHGHHRASLAQYASSAAIANATVAAASATSATAAIGMPPSFAFPPPMPRSRTTPTTPQQQFSRGLPPSGVMPLGQAPLQLQPMHSLMAPQLQPPPPPPPSHHLSPHTLQQSLQQQHHQLHQQYQASASAMAAAAAAEEQHLAAWYAHSYNVPSPAMPPLSSFASPSASTDLLMRQMQLQQLHGSTPLSATHSKWPPSATNSANSSLTPGATPRSGSLMGGVGGGAFSRSSASAASSVPVSPARSWSFTGGASHSGAFSSTPSSAGAHSPLDLSRRTSFAEHEEALAYAQMYMGGGGAAGAHPAYAQHVQPPMSPEEAANGAYHYLAPLRLAQHSIAGSPVPMSLLPSDGGPASAFHPSRTSVATRPLQTIHSRHGSMDTVPPQPYTPNSGPNTATVTNAAVNTAGTLASSHANDQVPHLSRHHSMPAAVSWPTTLPTGVMRLPTSASVDATPVSSPRGIDLVDQPATKRSRTGAAAHDASDASDAEAASAEKNATAYAHSMPTLSRRLSSPTAATAETDATDPRIDLPSSSSRMSPHLAMLQSQLSSDAAAASNRSLVSSPAAVVSAGAEPTQADMEIQEIKWKKQLEIIDTIKTIIQQDQSRAKQQQQQQQQQQLVQQQLHQQHHQSQAHPDPRPPQSPTRTVPRTVDLDAAKMDADEVRSHSEERMEL